MSQALDRAATATVRWFHGNAGKSAASTLVGIVVARHLQWVVLALVALVTWWVAEYTTWRNCYRGECVRCGYTVNSALILDGSPDWVTGRLVALNVPEIDVPRLLGWRPGSQSATVSHAVFVCSGCAGRCLWFQPGAARLGRLLPVLRQPKNPGLLARWAAHLRVPRRKNIGKPIGRPASGYLGATGPSMGLSATIARVLLPAVLSDQLRHLLQSGRGVLQAPAGPVDRGRDD